VAPSSIHRLAIATLLVTGWSGLARAEGPHSGALALASHPHLDAREEPPMEAIPRSNGVAELALAKPGITTRPPMPMRTPESGLFGFLSKGSAPIWASYVFGTVSLATAMQATLILHDAHVAVTHHCDMNGCDEEGRAGVDAYRRWAVRAPLGYAVSASTFALGTTLLARGETGAPAPVTVVPYVSPATAGLLIRGYL
jgi:hypothetical protein